MATNLPDRKSTRSGLAAPITITVAKLANGTDLVSVSGEVDLFTAPQLERVLDDVTQAGDGDVFVEFSRETFIDSTGLNVLIQSAKRLEEAGRSLRVTTENSHIRSVIETMGLVEKVGLVDSPA